MIRPSLPTTKDAPEAVGYVDPQRRVRRLPRGRQPRVQGMAEAVAPHGVDIAFVPINGRNGNMNGTDAARLAYEAGAQIAIPATTRCSGTTRRARRGSSPSAPGSARSTGSRASASGSRSTTGTEPGEAASARGPAVVEHDGRAGERAPAGPEQERRHVRHLGGLDQLA